MSAKVIVLSAIKGGVAKTTTCATTAWLLGEKGYKVLAIDGDPQGNLTECFYLTPVRELRLQGSGGILEAIKQKDPKRFIQNYTDNIDLLVGEEIFGTFIDYMYTSCKEKNKYSIIKERIIDVVKNDYDFIIIDTAPTLNSTLTNFLVASDYVIGLFETSKFSYSALYTLYETVYMVQQSLNPKLDFLGILISQIDNRRTDNKDFLELIKQSEDFGHICFDTVIQRKAATGRLSFAGFFENTELSAAISQFDPYVEEIIKRINNRSK